MSEIRKHIAVLQVESGNGILTYLTTELSATPNDDGFPEIEISTRNKNVQLERHQVKSEISQEQITDLGAHGINAIEMVESALSNELIMSQEKQIYKKIKLLGYESNRKLWTKLQLFANKWTGYIPMTDASESGSLIRNIRLLSNIIAASSRMGPARFVIISPGLLHHFANENGFNAVEHDSSMGISTGCIYKCGTYGDNLDILVNPSLRWTDKRVVIGRDTLNSDEGVYLVEHSEGPQYTRIDRVDHGSLVPMTETILSLRYGLVHTPNASKNYITITCTEKKHNIITHIIDKYFKKKK
jgi:hypothetical protein